MKRTDGTPVDSRSLRSFLLEFLVYGLAVAVYFFLVLTFLADWLTELFTANREGYAFVALGLIVAQGFLLELLTRTVLDLFRPRPEE